MRAIHSTPRLVLLASLLAGGLVACQLIVGVKDDEGSVRPPDATAGDGGEEGGDVQPSCFLVKPPGPPSADSDGGDASSGTAFYALERVAIDPTGSTSAIGYDLDDRCTGLPTSTGVPGTAPCSPPDGSTRIDDADGGVDNALRGILAYAALIPTHVSADPAANFFNDDIEAGTRTLIVALRNYNGAADDTEVAVGLIASEGLAPALDVGPSPEAGPRWDGNDVWGHTGEPYLSAAGPTGLDLKGYVKNHVLVTYPHDIRLSFGAFSLNLRAASIIATIDHTATPGRLTDGTIVGRALANEFVEASGQIPVTDKLCLLSGSKTAVDLICQARDITSTPGGNPSASCDSISVGIGFRAVGAGISLAAQQAPDGGVCDAALTCSP